MQELSWLEIQKALSNQRLTSYGIPAFNTPSEILTRYVWNIRLGEALYPSLHCLEICLRNTIYVTASQAFGAKWLENANLLAPREVVSVSEAKNELLAMQKPIEPGRLIAELSFGFWTSLFDVRYEQKFWPRLLSGCFPQIPRPIRTRKTLSGRLNTIRKFRNRVFHHEPIWHWKDLAQHHARIVEVVSWISPQVQQMLGEIDRFGQVLTGGPAPVISVSPGNSGANP